jgi:hypothetical protein
MSAMPGIKQVMNKPKANDSTKSDFAGNADDDNDVDDEYGDDNADPDFGSVGDHSNAAVVVGDRSNAAVEAFGSVGDHSNAAVVVGDRSNAAVVVGDRSNAAVVVGDRSNTAVEAFGSVGDRSNAAVVVGDRSNAAVVAATVGDRSNAAVVEATGPNGHDDDDDDEDGDEDPFDLDNRLDPGYHAFKSMLDTLLRERIPRQFQHYNFKEMTRVSKPNLRQVLAAIDGKI